MHTATPLQELEFLPMFEMTESTRTAGIGARTTRTTDTDAPGAETGEQ